MILTPDDGDARALRRSVRLNNLASLSSLEFVTALSNRCVLVPQYAAALLQRGVTGADMQRRSVISCTSNKCSIPR